MFWWEVGFIERLPAHTITKWDFMILEAIISSILDKAEVVSIDKGI